MKMGLIFLMLLVMGRTSAAYADRASRWEIEAGVLTTKTMEIHGYQQSSATQSWSGTAPDLRLEYWRVSPSSWNFGFNLQPVYVKYSKNLTSDLNYKGKVYQAGDPGSLTYQFHVLGWTANYPVLKAASGEDQLRLGFTVIGRYAQLDFKASGNSFRDTNLIAFPLLNLESQIALSPGYGIFSRASFLPSPTGNVFLDGLYDVFVGGRKYGAGGSSLDLGVRLFFGGYDPQTPDDYANRIFFTCIVSRYSF